MGRKLLLYLLLFLAVYYWLNVSEEDIEIEGEGN